MLNSKTSVFGLKGLPVTRRVLISFALALVLLPNNMVGQDPPAAGGKVQTSTPGSRFGMPKTLNEGRDPFYPTSTRVIAMTRPIKKTESGPATLELKGISGSVDRPLAIINNRTMAEGEEQDVTTPQGRVRVMCLEIKGTKVKVRAQGQIRELLLRKGI